MMDCGHPLAARQIVRDDTTLPERLVTRCWACAVQREPTSKPGWPAKWASKERKGQADRGR